jgi:formate hydrogenlyase subunit 3/multisubunit Na+/H+ antiporter MnhD subunit
MINALYRLEPSETVVKGNKMPGTMKIPLVVLAILVIVIGLWPGLMNWLTIPAGNALVNMF